MRKIVAHVFMYVGAAGIGLLCGWAIGRVAILPVWAELVVIIGIVLLCVARVRTKRV